MTIFSLVKKSTPSKSFFNDTEKVTKWYTHFAEIILVISQFKKQIWTTLVRNFSHLVTLSYLILLYFTGKYTSRRIYESYIRDLSGLFSLISHVCLSLT